MKRSFLGLAPRVALGLVALAALAVPTAAATPATTVQCGQVITQDTRLANDLIGCSDNGLIIGADNITLDLNGHTISGDNNPDDSEEAGVVNPGYDGVTIKNGTINGFTLVINAGTEQVTGGTIRDVTGEGIFGDIFLVGNGNVIEKNTLLGGNQDAINVHGDGNVITKNLIVGNNDIAIIVSGNGNSITKNTIRSGNSCEAFIDTDGQNNVVAKNDTTATGGFCTAQ
jgi:hypothetical protein